MTLYTSEDKARFHESGYHHAPAVLQGEHLTQLQNAFDRVWETETPPVNQHKLLRHREFIELIEHPAILEFHRLIFGLQVQLLQYDLLRQGPRNTSSHERMWHRDFDFPGDHPLSINTLLFLDDISEEVGPTRVVPGTHRGTAWPAPEEKFVPHPQEKAVHVRAGDAIFINSAIWHTGGRNKSDGLRRGIYLYYGQWFLKRLDGEHALPPAEALLGASEQRLHLLGLQMPSNDIHMYGSI